MNTTQPQSWNKKHTFSYPYGRQSAIYTGALHPNPKENQQETIEGHLYALLTSHLIHIFQGCVQHECPILSINASTYKRPLINN